MNIDEYRELLPDVSYRETLLEIYEFFERQSREYVDYSNSDNDNILVPYFVEIREQLERNEISKKLTSLRKETRMYTFARSELASFSQNLSQFRRMGTSDIRKSKIKWGKVLINAHNAAMILLTAKEFKEIYDNSVQGSLILAMGIFDENISTSVQNEIDNIAVLSKRINGFAVLPLIKCSTNVFIRIISDIKFFGIHIAGHGNVNEMVFSDNIMKPATFNLYLDGQKLEFAIMNFCHSYESFGGKKANNCSHTVLHKDELYCCNAEKLTDDYYQSLFSGTSVNTALNNAVSGNSGNYSLIV